MTTEPLERAFASTRGIIANVKPDQLTDPTPCASWDVRAVMNHVIGGAYFCADTMTSDEPVVPSGADFTDGDFVARYDEGIKQALAAFNAPGAMERTVQLPFGELPAAAWMGIFSTDTFTHGWDLARSTGQPSDLNPELATQLLQGAKAFIQPAFRGPDGQSPFGAEQPAPANATPADELAAFLGRTC